jgi:hypothetical protein
MKSLLELSLVIQNYFDDKIDYWILDIKGEILFSVWADFIMKSAIYYEHFF